MSNKVISMQAVRSIIQLLEKNYSLRRIARELHLSRKTITQYKERLLSSGYSFKDLRRLEDQELASIVYTPLVALPAEEGSQKADFLMQVEYFLSELGRTGVTRRLLWQEYKKQYPKGYGYTQFCVQLARQTRVRNPSMTLSYRAAEMVMVDYAGEKMSYVDRGSGEVIFCPVLVCVLPFSGLSFSMALPDATIPQTLKALNACLRYFGGVPHTLKTDNMKQVVSRSCRYEPVFSEAMQAWAQHNNLTLLTTRVARPKDKAPVENGVKITYRRIYAPLRNERFHSLSQLNGGIKRQVDLHNQTLLQGRDYCRRELFEAQEKPLLQPLPAEDFVLKHRAEAKVQKNYHITLGEDWHHYSVPYTYIGKSVTALYDTDTVEIYYQFSRIALHRRSYKRHEHTTQKEHMPEGHQHYFEQRGWTGEYFLEQALKIGPATHAFTQELLKSKRFTEQTYNACRGVLRLARDYGAGRLEAACLRSLKGGVCTYRTVHNILLNHLDKVDSPEQPFLFFMPSHQNLRGPEAYE
jgi:transposase